MIYPDFNEVEISFQKPRRDGDGTWWDRGYIIPPKKVQKCYGKTDVFISAARFKNLKKHTDENKKDGQIYPHSGLGTVAGFDGELYYDFIIIDIDKIHLKQFALFLDHLNINYDIPKDILRLYFSGSKGFHVLIPSTVFDLRPSYTLNVQVRKIVEELCSNVIEFDGSLYDKLQAYRLRYTVHSKHDLYKTPIDFSDIQKGIDYIKTLASRQAHDFVYPESPIDPLPHLAEMASSFNGKHSPKGNDNYSKSTEFDDYNPPFRKLCIFPMLEGTTEHAEDGTPGRIEAGIRLATHFKKEKWGRQYTEAMMDTWNAQNKPPLSTKEIQGLIRVAYQSPYDYGCHDPVHKRYCNTDCYLFSGEPDV